MQKEIISDTWIVLLDKWLDRMCRFKQLYSSRFAAKVQRSVAMDCGPVVKKRMPTFLPTQGVREEE